MCNPTERLETSYWLHPHYPREYGATADGLDAYVVKHLAAFRSCEATHGTRRCAFLFENLERSLNTRTFFACDQVIRGIYWPFLVDWRAAFGSGLLVLRAEEMMDAPSIHRPRLLTFLGLSHQPPPGSDVSDGPPNYAAMHAASLKSYSAKPMHNHTRQALDAFFAPHNRKLADLLGWEGARDLWRVSRPLPPEAWSQAASMSYRRYGPHFPDSQRTRYHDAGSGGGGGGGAGSDADGDADGATAGEACRATGRDAGNAIEKCA